MSVIEISSETRDHPHFSRARGIVWVCDIANSSKQLNDDRSVLILEEFLKRFFWLAPRIVAAAEGRFVKWNGDGFLAWFEVPLHRQLVEKTGVVFEAASELTFLVNVTQLGLKPQARFKIRHGIVYEQDALLLSGLASEGNAFFDLLGRGVVLAFRLAGINAKFSSIVTHHELVKVTKAEQQRDYQRSFARYVPSRDERLRYFKGEKYGTEDLFWSVDRKRRPRKLESVHKQIRRAIQKAESPSERDSPFLGFYQEFVRQMLEGPPWARKAIEDEAKLVREGLLEPLKKLEEVLRDQLSKPEKSTGAG